MEKWYEVFDNEQVQLLTRKQAGTLTAVGIALFSFTISLLVLADRGEVSGLLAIAIGIVLWTAVIRWGIARFMRLKAVFWCVKLSEHQLVGYDYTRKKTTLCWEDILRVDLTSRGLVILGSEGHPFEVLHLFPDFATLSHRVISYAEANHIPIFIDGLPLDTLDVFQLYPNLASARPPDTSGTPSGTAPL